MFAIKLPLSLVVLLQYTKYSSIIQIFIVKLMQLDPNYWFSYLHAIWAKAWHSQKIRTLAKASSLESLANILDVKTETTDINLRTIQFALENRKREELLKLAKFLDRPYSKYYFQIANNQWPEPDKQLYNQQVNSLLELRERKLQETVRARKHNYYSETKTSENQPITLVEEQAEKTLFTRAFSLFKNYDSYELSIAAFPLLKQLELLNLTRLCAGIFLGVGVQQIEENLLCLDQ